MEAKYPVVEENLDAKLGETFDIRISRAVHIQPGLAYQGSNFEFIGKKSEGPGKKIGAHCQVYTFKALKTGTYSIDFLDIDPTKENYKVVQVTRYKVSV